ncbi:4'-phosphopantetheinyl transferase superfamily protein [Diaphorobacter sp. HDW4B]|uniref:4'-phosphopantetheinyl transferase family protein n=1 Tax=Diaphorobacter sp. HDW4B TaxID=2714925 RepID=UPI00140A35CA|nr:4'-phosphopantetheinyl transferase superfamily protein [Diaphorobacter sp. HDW4B]QIL69311.1 4'-phosphopantetheinyl transferase superfamily protein [Diaphorobacter sp. HDW4B]
MAAGTVRLLVATQSAMWSAAERSLYATWLTASENDRLAQMQSPARREEFIACRYALRLLLAGHPEQITQWPLEAPAGQAPQSVRSDLHLSLSHSHGYIACAVASQPVGVDIEALARKPRSALHELAELACTPQEREQLNAIADEQQRHLQFMQWWSLKEAWFKRAGTGVDFALLPRLECRKQSGDLVQSSLECDSSNAEHARSWLAKTPSEQSVVLSVCLPVQVMVCELRDEARLDWSDAGAFALALA